MIIKFFLTYKVNCIVVKLRVLGCEVQHSFIVIQSPQKPCDDVEVAKHSKGCCNNGYLLSFLVVRSLRWKMHRISVCALLNNLKGLIDGGIEDLFFGQSFLTLPAEMTTISAKITFRNILALKIGGVNS